MDGLCNEVTHQLQPSSSSESLVQSLFNNYSRSVFPIENGHVPGIAFKNSLPYVELDEVELHRLASMQTQMQFYQEARIKMAWFMGCRSGEIELGTSNASQIDMEMEMRNLFPENFSLQSPTAELPQPVDQTRPSSSSSSLRSLSMDSPDSSSLFFNKNNPSTSYIMETLKDIPIEQAIMKPISTMQAPSRFQSISFPTPQSDDDAMTKAMLAVISSASSSSSSSRQRFPYRKPSAFKNYSLAFSQRNQVRTNFRSQFMMKRAFSFFRNLNLMRHQEQIQGINQPTTTQLHHMISERKRREKLNESFQALRSLLPPGAKRDKASVLISATEYLISLKAQVSELSKRNQLLEQQLSQEKQTTEEASGSSSERFSIRVTNEPESSSDEQIIQLRVSLRGNCSTLDLAMRVLEFVKQVDGIILLSMETDTQMTESRVVHRLIMRLKIQQSEWDEAAFREAVRRVVDDLGH